MRLILASASPAPARSARADRRRARRGRSRRHRRDAAEGRAAAPLMPRGWRREGGGVAEPGALVARRRHGGRGGPAHPAQGRGRGGSARLPGACCPAAATASISAVTLIDAGGTGAPSPVELDRHLQAADRRTSSTPISPAANGAARRAAMRSRAGPRRWCGALTGSYSGVIGLPLFETRALLRAAGYPLG